MTPNQKPPDWESFETYKGEPPASGLPPWAERAFHYFMVVVGLALIFGLAGALAYLLPYGLRSTQSLVATTDTAFIGWLRFAVGGIVGDFMILYWYFRRR